MNATAPSHDRIEALARDLAQAIGEDAISRDHDTLAAHSGDWSEAQHHVPSLLIMPKTPETVAAALACCSRHRQPVVVQGGRTGLAGGATPQPGEVALSLHRLNQIEVLDEVAGTVQVQAGVVLETLQQHVEARGWYFPLDLGARGSCQVGGNASTNAGGNRVIRYGCMRELTLGLEVALPDGRLLTMLNKVTKNTTGTELRHIFIGSEGTLGVITRLVLKLVPLPASTVTALCALPSFDAATRLLKTLKRDMPGLSAFELMWHSFMNASAEASRSALPFDRTYPVYALLEVQGANEAHDREQLEAVIEQSFDDGTISDAIVAQSIADARRLWAYREAIGELLGQMKPRASFDIGIPISRMDDFVTVMHDRLSQRYPRQRHLFFGHLGDSNLHLMTGPYSGMHELEAVEGMVYQEVGNFGGSISAEHGIGVIKRDFLHYTRSPEEVAVMRDLKALFDPYGILNPGRILRP